MKFATVRQIFRKKIKKEEGSSLIEYVIGLLLLIMFSAFCLEFIVIANKYHFVGSEMTELARTVSIQGGIENQTPKGYPGGNKAYQTSSEITTKLQQITEMVGIQNNEWTVTYKEIDNDGKVIKEGTLQSNTQFRAERSHKISLEFQARYRWSVLGMMVPGLSTDRTMTITRMGVSEYIRSYD